MKNTLINLAPTMVLVAAVTYLCWPYLDGGGNALKLDMGGKKLSRIDKDSLTPTLPSTSERNPFKPAVTQPISNEKLTQIAKIAQQAKLLMPETPVIDVPAIVNSLELTGTILGAVNCAVIDGHLRFEGDEIPIDSKHEVRCTLFQVKHNKVVVRVEGQTLNLDYPEITSANKPGAKTAARRSNAAANRATPSNRRRPLPGDDVITNQRSGSGEEPDGDIFDSIQRALTSAVFEAEAAKKAAP